MVGWPFVSQIHIKKAKQMHHKDEHQPEHGREGLWYGSAVNGDC